MPTLQSVRAVAHAFWQSSCRSSSGADCMIKRLDRALGAAGVNPGDDPGALSGVAILTALGRRKLSRKTVAVYYQAIRRALALSGVPTADWPRAPTLERKLSRRTTEAVQKDLATALAARRWFNTADLVVLLGGLGLRIGVEALRPGALVYDPEGCALTVTGKGGHERIVPVVDSRCRTILGSPARLRAIQSVPYFTHRARIRRMGGNVGLANLHGFRHDFATRALRASGGNLRVVQKLLGHSNPATTAIYADAEQDQLLETVRTMAQQSNLTGDTHNEVYP